ncbi:MAG: copper resistance protein CopC [Gammaproteobacteria bacterium]|nr:copper resistance protein CopC [Gammaproteobacteria bacterium]
MKHACRTITLAFAILAGSAQQFAWAEGVLVGGQPRDNSVVASFDGMVRLWFSGNISERAPSLVVVDGAGQRVDNGDARLAIAARSELTATTRPLQPGSYVVRYRVVTEDGLVVSGLYRFAVKA